MDYSTFVIVCGFFVIGSAADFSDLHVKFAVWNGYYDMPLTVATASKSGYVKEGHDVDLNVDLWSYPSDPRFFLLFDSYGNIAGIRIGYIKSDVDKRAKEKGVTFNFNYTAHPMYISATYCSTDVWYTSVLFVSPDKLRAGGRPDTQGLVAEDIYVKLSGEWTVMPRDQCKAESLGFTKQACFIGMGMHYFHNMKPTTDCKDLQGVFLLYESGQLIGLGIIPFGTFSSGTRTWFEDPTASVVKSIVPNRPACLTDWVTDYGTTSLHIFFKKYPRLTFCIWPWQKSNQCSITTV